MTTAYESMITNTKVITIPCTEISCLWVFESYVLMYVVRFATAIGVSTDAKIAMDFNCPCSKCCSPFWICYERYSYWLFSTFV